jgi:hypothetical protein
MRCVAAQKQVQKQIKDREAIAALAYEFWVLRGSPSGSPEVDWCRAELEWKRRMERHSAGRTGRVIIRRLRAGVKRLLPGGSPRLPERTPAGAPLGSGLLSY